MYVKFLGKSMKEYQGPNGMSGSLCMKPGDIAEVADATGAALQRHYRGDFAEASTPGASDKDHAPKANKQAKKTAAFKSK